MKTLGLCCDHAGYELKEYVKQILDSKGLSYKDFGTCSTESCDYPDFAHPLAYAVEAGEVYPGIAICGSGNGIAMTLNKHQGIRAALCWQEEIARLAREHNDAQHTCHARSVYQSGGSYSHRRSLFKHSVRRRSTYTKNKQNPVVKTTGFFI